MRNLKKVLGLVLCLAMMLSIMVVGAGAAFADQSDIDSKHQEAVDMCAALNIITGFENGKFMPNDNVTREQMAKMICVLDNGGKEPQLATGNTFTDVPADRWSNKYIESCAARGIVVGTGGGKFSPAGKVTATQAAKMLLVELGYDDDLQKYSGSNWATQVNIDATKKGYYDELEDIDVNAPLTREHAAQMIWNALQANEVEYTYTLVTNPDGSITSKVDVGDKTIGTENGKPVYTTLLADKYGVVDNEYGRMVRFSYNPDKDEWTYYFDEESSTFDEKITDNQFTSSEDFTDLYGQTLKVIYSTKNNNKDVDKVFGMYAKDGKVLVSGVIGDMSTLTETSSKIKIDGTEYKLEKTGTVQDSSVAAYNVPVYLFSHNTDIENASTYGENKDLVISEVAGVQFLAGFAFNAIDDDDNGKIDFFVIYPFMVAQVDYVGAKNFTVRYQGDNTTNFKFEDVVAYDNMAEDDFVVYTPELYSATGDDTFEKATNVIAGDVTSTRGNYKFAVDGTWYEGALNIADAFKIGSGGSVKDAVIVNGYVYMANGSGAKDASDYVVVIGADLDAAYTPTVKLLFSDGTKKIVDLDKIYTSTEKTATEDLKKVDPVGILYTYETNSDNEYILTPAVRTADADGSGFDIYSGDSSTINKGSNDKVKYINNADIADDAVIFVKEGTEDSGYTYKVITGARLKTTDGSKMSAIDVYTDKPSGSGYNTVKLAYVANTTEIKTADSNYGFILQDADKTTNADKNDVYSVTFINEEGQETTLLTKDVNDKNFKKLNEGVVFSYTLNSDGDIDSVKIIGRSGKDGSGADAIVAASGDYVTFEAQKDKNEKTGTRFEITKDTVIFVIDAEKPELSEGKITEAHKDVNNNWVKNVIVDVDTKDEEVDLLVIDVNNDILDVE